MYNSSELGHRVLSYLYRNCRVAPGAVAVLDVSSVRTKYSRQLGGRTAHRESARRTIQDR